MNALKYVLLLLCVLLSACASFEGPVAVRPGSFFHYSDSDYLNYEVDGQGPITLVFLHGFGSSLRNWDDIRPDFDHDAYTMYFLDLKGFGFSSVPTNTSYSFKTNAELVSSFARELQFTNYWLIGHSFGGGVALYADSILSTNGAVPPTGLVLLDCAAYISKLPFFIEYLRYPIVSRAGFNATSPAFKARYTLERVYASPDTISDTLVQRYAVFITDNKYPVFAGTARDILPKNIDLITQYYHNITVPSLIIWGENDTVLPISSGLRLAGELPGAELHIIPDCGHIPQEEYPDETSRLIIDFLNRHK